MITLEVRVEGAHSVEFSIDFLLWECFIIVSLLQANVFALDVVELRQPPAHHQVALACSPVLVPDLQDGVAPADVLLDERVLEVDLVLRRPFPVQRDVVQQELLRL